MGFKCPVCFEDFLRDKEKWEKHIKEKHMGVGEKIKSVLYKITKTE